MRAERGCARQRVKLERQESACAKVSEGAYSKGMTYPYWKLDRPVSRQGYGDVLERERAAAAPRRADDRLALLTR